MTEILKSLHAVNEELAAITKNQQGHNYKFRGIDQVFNSLAPLFKKYGVLVSRRNLESERIVRTVVGKYGPKDYIETFIKKCDYVFTSTKDGSEFITQGFGEGQDSSGGDKSASMATSNAYKYVIFEMFSIATEEQKDSDQRTAEQAERDAKETRDVENNRKNQANNKPPEKPRSPSGSQNPPPPKDGDLTHTIRGRIGYLTDAFKNNSRLQEIYKALGVSDPKQISTAPFHAQKEWLDYLNRLQK